MVIAPPLMAVVPVAAFCTTEAAVTAALKVVVPVEVNERAPSAPLVAPPTTPVKVRLPEPEVMVRPLAALVALSTVSVKENTPLELPVPVEFKVTPALSTTGPV